MQHDEQAKLFRHVLYGQTIAEAVANDRGVPFQSGGAILSLYVTDELYQSADQSQVKTEYQDFIAGLKQADLAEVHRVPVVMPAGDHSLAHPALPGTLKLADTTIGDHVLVVTALNAQGNGLVGGANKCGDAADFCLAAPGEHLLTILLNTLDQPDGPSYKDHPTAVNSRRVSGSLYAASVAVGALALVRQAFSATMSGADIVKRLLDTADKTGIFADSSTYGQGVINLNAATTPIGGTSIPLTADARGASLPLGRTGLALDSALFGDAFTRAFANRSLIGLDELYSPFAYRLDNLVQQHTPRYQSSHPTLSHVGHTRLPDGSVLTSHLAGDGGDEMAIQLRQGAWNVQVAQAHPGLGHPAGEDLPWLHLNDPTSAAPWAASDLSWQGTGAGWQLASQRWQLHHYRSRTEQTTAAVNTDRQHRALALSWQGHFGDHRFGMQQVHNDSTGELLGLSVSGGLGGILKGHTRAFNAWGQHALGARAQLTWSLWEMRSASLQLAPGALSDVAGLAADSRSVVLSLPGPANAQWHLSVQQPLRARSGQLHFALPVAHTPRREILFADLNSPVAPSGREIRLQADFSLPLGHSAGQLRMAIGHARHPGHNRHAPDDPYALINLKLPL